MKKVLEIYLKYLGFSKVSLFVTTNNLARMAFCPNKTYLQVNFLVAFLTMILSLN
jgi:hypothetical protein